MPAYFFDSSSLVKRFGQERGSKFVRSLLKPAAKNAVYIARITPAEVVSAFTRKSRGGTSTPLQSRKAIQRFERSFPDRYSVVEIRSLLVNKASELVKVHGLRAYDAVQLAAALTANDERRALGGGFITLVSADKQLNRAAILEGLLVEDPNNYQ
jgi:predicted nucleic acid-binding protein